MVGTKMIRVKPPYSLGLKKFYLRNKTQTLIGCNDSYDLIVGDANLKRTLSLALNKSKRHRKKKKHNRNDITFFHFLSLKKKEGGLYIQVG